MKLMRCLEEFIIQILPLRKKYTLRGSKEAISDSLIQVLKNTYRKTIDDEILILSHK